MGGLSRGQNLLDPIGESGQPLDGYWTTVHVDYKWDDYSPG